MRSPLLAVPLALALSACAMFRHNDRPPALDELAKQYGCSEEVVEANWTRHRLVPAAPGTPICATLGRYGQPVSVHMQRVAGMQLLSLLQRPSNRYINVTFVHYDDTRANRRIGRPIGRWVVQRYTVQP